MALAAAALTPGAEALEPAPELGVERRDLALGGAADAERQHQAVDRQRSAPAISETRPLTTRR